MEWLQLGLGGLQAMQSYSSASDNASYEEAYQKYQNTMTQLSASVADNGINDNEVFSNQAFAQEGMQIQKQDAISVAQAQVQAAASGVTGTSVNDTLTDINRQSGQAESQREDQLTQSWTAFDAQRQNTAMTAATKMNYSPIQQPNLAASLMGGLGSGLNNVAKTYPGGLSAWTDSQGITGANGILGSAQSWISKQFTGTGLGL